MSSTLVTETTLSQIDDAYNHIFQPSQVELKNKLTASLQRGDTPSKEYPVYDTKQSDVEAPVKWSTSSLPLLPGSFWPGVVAPDRVLSMDPIGLFDI